MGGGGGWSGYVVGTSRPGIVVVDSTFPPIHPFPRSSSSSSSVSIRHFPRKNAPRFSLSLSPPTPPSGATPSTPLIYIRPLLLKGRDFFVSLPFVLFFLFPLSRFFHVPFHSLSLSLRYYSTGQEVEIIPQRE